MVVLCKPNVACARGPILGQMLATSLDNALITTLALRKQYWAKIGQNFATR